MKVCLYFKTKYPQLKTIDDDNNWTQIFLIARLMLSFPGSSISQYNTIHNTARHTWKSPEGTYKCNPSQLSQRGRTRALCPDRPGPCWSRHVAIPARALQDNSTSCITPSLTKGGAESKNFTESPTYKPLLHLIQPGTVQRHSFLKTKHIKGLYFQVRLNH